MPAPRPMITGASFRNRGKGEFALSATLSMTYLNEYKTTPDALKMMRSYMTKEQALTYLRNRLIRETVNQFENELTQLLDEQLRRQNEAKTKRSDDGTDS